MLRLKKGIDLEDLKAIGFKKDAGATQDWFYPTSEGQIFIWTHRDEEFVSKGVYIETKNHSMILSDLDVFYDLVKNDYVEKV